MFHRPWRAAGAFCRAQRLRHQGAQYDQHCYPSFRTSGALPPSHLSENSRENLHIRQTLGSNTVLRQMAAAHSLAEFAAAPANPLSGRSLIVLVAFPSSMTEAHRWPRGRLDDRPGVRGVVLLAADKRLHAYRRNEPHLVHETGDRPSPTMRRREASIATTAGDCLAKKPRR